MDLECWSEDWGIPSIDPECLKIMAFSKFSGAPLNLKPTNNPFWTPRGDLPVLRHSGVILTDFPSVARHLRSCNYSADYNLSQKQVAEAGAFIQMVEERLGPALKYLMWIDAKNQVEVTRPWFGSHLPFPLGLYYPNKFEQQAVQLIESLHGQQNEHNQIDIGGDSVVETNVYRGAEECLTSLSNRLGDQHYMFGRSPSSADAVLYAYLAPLLKAPFHSCGLQNYLKNCTNLVKFTVRISQNYFPKVVKNWEEKQRENSSNSTSGPSSNSSSSTSPTSGEEGEEAWPNQGRNKVLAGCVATTAMLGYAYTSGLVDIVRNVEIRWGEEDDEEYDEEED